MAQTESQLEIYKIILGRKTVRQIIREKAEADEITINTDIEYSNYLFRKLLNKLTEDAAWTSDKMKLGLSLLLMKAKM